MTIREMTVEAIKILTKNSIENPSLDTRIIICHVINKDNLFFATNPSHDLTAKEEKRILSLIEKRANNVPIAYLTNSKEFMSLDFFVDKNVLIPRPDTETLTQWAIDYIGKSKFSVLDIGTGSGAIAVCVAYYCECTTVKGIDISQEALEIAKKNANANKVESNRISFENVDILNAIPCGKFSMILSNPPYIHPDAMNSLSSTVKDFEPIFALTDFNDGLTFYRRIAKIAKEILIKNGILGFEIGFDQGQSVATIMRENGFTDIEIIKDLAQNERVVTGKLL